MVWLSKVVFGHWESVIRRSAKDIELGYFHDLHQYIGGQLAFLIKRLRPLQRAIIVFANTVFGLVVRVLVSFALFHQGRVQMFRDKGWIMLVTEFIGTNGDAWHDSLAVGSYALFLLFLERERWIKSQHHSMPAQRSPGRGPIYRLSTDCPLHRRQHASALW